MAASQLVAIDGKTMRGTIPKGSTQGVHLLAAYLPEEGIVLKQVEVGSKENEISAAPELIKGLDLKTEWSVLTRCKHNASFLLIFWLEGDTTSGLSRIISPLYGRT
jgi:hypothetical protein